jgi:hypothetical protein
MQVQMAINIRFFMTNADELAFLRFVGRFRLEVYPVRVPPDWKTFVASDDALERLPEDALYFSASEVGPVQVDKIKSGPDKGFWRVDEVRSPVIYFERSRRNEAGELLSGELWSQLDWTPQTGRRYAAPDRFRTIFLEIDRELRTRFRKSEPKGFLIGPNAARAAKDGLVLRDSERGGGTVKPFR